MKQEELRDALLSGKITAKAFYDGLVILDQSSGDRVEALHNLEVLYDPQVIAYMDAADQDSQGYYYSILCLTEFHVGQIKAYQERKQDEALPHFKKALEYTKKSSGAPEFASYVNATIAYIESDIERLEKYMHGDKRGNNPVIMKHMYEGLKERGHPAYWEDYRV